MQIRQVLSVFSNKALAVRGGERFPAIPSLFYWLFAEPAGEKFFSRPFFPAIRRRGRLRREGYG